MRNIVICLILSTILGMFYSCAEDTINSRPVDFTPIEILLGDSVKINGFVNNIYADIPTGHNRLGSNSMVAASIDEAVHASVGSEAERWGTGSWGPTTLHDNSFSSSYDAIRKTFIYEELIRPNIQDFIMGPYGRDILYGQVLFLRALYNFELLKRFGGYPIVDRMLNAGEELSFPRNTYDQCVEYIASLCDEASGLLPTSYAANQLGRATKGAALALKSRLLLYAASPLFNDASNPSDGLERGTYNISKWEDAAEAAASIINLASNGSAVYSLFNDYGTFFNTLNNNREIIFSRMEGATNTLERLNGPVSITGGLGGTNPTLELVDSYEMINGTRFDWDNPIHAANPFLNREPRFYKSILYNGATWMNNMTIETFSGGNDLEGTNATRTGFYLRKFLSVNARWNAPTGTAFHCFPLFRFGEVLLNYAEAMNEAYGPDTDPKGFSLTARDAIKMIRVRAGITGNIDLSQTVPAGDKVKMRDAIRHERKIELAFEEHRHLDLRRWKIAVEILNSPVHGISITKNTDGTFSYSKAVVENRVFDPKMYLYPFPQTEISRNQNLIQNTGW